MILITLQTLFNTTNRMMVEGGKIKPQLFLDFYSKDVFKVQPRQCQVQRPSFHPTVSQVTFAN